MGDIYHYDEASGKGIVYAGSVPIDDTQASEDTVYSSAKVETMVEEVQSDWHEESFSYTDNSYTTKEDVERCSVQYNPTTKTGIIHFNLRVNKLSMPPSSNFINIGTIPVNIKIGLNFVVPGQTAGSLLANISTTGVVSIFNNMSSTITSGSWFRTVIPIVLA